MCLTCKRETSLEQWRRQRANENARLNNDPLSVQSRTLAWSIDPGLPNKNKESVQTYNRFIRFPKCVTFDCDSNDTLI